MNLQEKDIPHISYFAAGNSFTGSCGARFRYRIAKQDAALLGAYWQTDVCYEKAEQKGQREFDLTEAGLQACIAWLADASGTIAK